MVTILPLIELDLKHENRILVFTLTMLIGDRLILQQITMIKESSLSDVDNNDKLMLGENLDAGLFR